MNKVNNVFDTFTCFIFSNDIKQVKYIKDINFSSYIGKKISITTEVYNLRNYLKENLAIETSCTDILSDNKVFIMCDNYKKIQNIKNVEIVDKEIIYILKSHLSVLASINFFKLASDVDNGIKLSKSKAKLKDKLKTIIYEDSFCRSIE